MEEVRRPIVGVQVRGGGTGHKRRQNLGEGADSARGNLILEEWKPESGGRTSGGWIVYCDQFSGAWVNVVAEVPIPHGVGGHQICHHIALAQSLSFISGKKESFVAP